VQIVDACLANVLGQSDRQLRNASERLDLARMLIGQWPHAADDVVALASRVIHRIISFISLFIRRTFPRPQAGARAPHSRRALSLAARDAGAEDPSIDRARLVWRQAGAFPRRPAMRGRTARALRRRASECG